MGTPKHDNKKNRTAAAEGAASDLPPRARHSQIATAHVMSGTGQRNRMFGYENQRAAIECSMMGVQRLTMAIAARPPIRQIRPARLAHCCSAPSVLMMSQPAPNNP